MDKARICSLIEQATKSLTVHTVDVVFLQGKLLKVRIVAEKYASQTLPERVTTLLDLLKQGSPEILENFLLSFIPLTPIEAKSWETSENQEDQSSGDGQQSAAKPIDL